MSNSINNLANSAYYQLSNPAGGQPGGTNAGGNVTRSLIQALSGSSASGTSSNSDAAYLLNLSPEAQQYLNSTGGSGVSSLSDILAGTGNASSASNPLGGTESFTLTPQQQTAITNILTQYQDAPYTQATFDQIQNALNAAGLGTNTLSEKDQSQSFNPTLLLVNDLNGGSASGNSGMASSSDEQTKSANYMQSIISQWQNMSGNSTKASANGSSQDTSTQTANAVAPVSSGGGA